MMKIITNNYAECYFPTNDGDVNISIGVNSVSDSDYSSISKTEMFKVLVSDGRFIVPTSETTPVISKPATVK